MSRGFYTRLYVLTKPCDVFIQELNTGRVRTQIQFGYFEFVGTGEVKWIYAFDTQTSCFTFLFYYKLMQVIHNSLSHLHCPQIDIVVLKISLHNFSSSLGSSWCSSSVFTACWALLLGCICRLLYAEVSPPWMGVWALWHWQVVSDKRQVVSGTEITNLELPRQRLIRFLMMPAFSINTVLTRTNSPKQCGYLPSIFAHMHYIDWNAACPRRFSSSAVKYTSPTGGGGGKFGDITCTILILARVTRGWCIYASGSGS